MNDEDARLDAILEVLISYARQQFAARIPVSEQRDAIDAIATGINLLAEELDGEVASRRDLEAAYARLHATQTELRFAEKLAAVGQLASGVAHELNNPATWVLLGVDTSRGRLARARALAEPGSPLARELAAIDETLADVRAGMERMRGVIGDLRALSRVDAGGLVELDLDDVVRAACQLARPAYHSVARLVLDLAGPFPIVADRGRIAQVITNLIVNAAYAVADGGGEHEIVIATRAAGGEVVLAVEDTGPGIPPELLERVFEPYFTTKPGELGSGLGLALVRKIAEAHGGAVRAARAARGGARIEVLLPRAPAQAAPPPGTEPRAACAGPAPRARILIVDDEPMLLRALEQALEEAHDVVTVAGGQAALELLACDAAFDLVICDLQMPHVDGVAVYDALAARAPELVPRFVIMSGGAVTPRAAEFMSRTQLRTLAKPIELDELFAVAAAAAPRAVSA